MKCTNLIHQVTQRPREIQGVWEGDLRKEVGTGQESREGLFIVVSVFLFVFFKLLSRVALPLGAWTS